MLRLPPWLLTALAPPRGGDAVDYARLDRLAGAVHRLGLGVPAIAFAAAQRPLLHIYGQWLRLAAPCLPAPAAGWAALLEDPESLDRFLAELEGLLAREGGRA